MVRELEHIDEEEKRISEEQKRAVFQNRLEYGNQIRKNFTPTVSSKKRKELEDQIRRTETKPRSKRPIPRNARFSDLYKQEHSESMKEFGTDPGKSLRSFGLPKK